MSACIRISIEQGITSSVAGNHIISLIIAGLGDPSKQAFRQGWLWCEDIFDTPGSVQRFHRAKVLTKHTNVKNRPERYNIMRAASRCSDARAAHKPAPLPQAR